MSVYKVKIRNIDYPDELCKSRLFRSKDAAQYWIRALITKYGQHWGWQSTRDRVWEYNGGEDGYLVISLQKLKVN